MQAVSNAMRGETVRQRANGDTHAIFSIKGNCVLPSKALDIQRRLQLECMLYVRLHYLIDMTPLCILNYRRPQRPLAHTFNLPVWESISASGIPLQHLSSAYHRPGGKQ